MYKAETNPTLEAARRPTHARSFYYSSRRTLLSSLGATIELPFLPPFEGCVLNATTPHPVTAAAQTVANGSQPVPTAVQTMATATISSAVGTLPDYFVGLSLRFGTIVQWLLCTCSMLVCGSAQANSTPPLLVTAYCRPSSS